MRDDSPVYLALADAIAEDVASGRLRPGARLPTHRELAARLGVPLAPPHSHPFNPLLVLRVTTQVQAEPERRRIIDALFRATWAEGRDVTDAGVVASVVSAAG